MNFANTQSTNDYYPFGSQLPGRGFNPGTYKFGFNGKENDDEVYGDGNFQNYGMRMYDTRICRFVSVDPITKKYPELTPYQFASCSPIIGVDLDGKELSVSIAPEASDITIQQLQSFIDILKLVKPLMTGDEEMMKFARGVSGMTNDQITKAITYSSVPIEGGINFHIEGPDGINCGACTDNEHNITISYFAIKKFSEMDKKDPSYKSQAIAYLYAGMHELGHVFDKIANDGISTGQPGLPEGSQEPPYNTSKTGERGNDFTFILVGEVQDYDQSSNTWTTRQIPKAKNYLQKYGQRWEMNKEKISKEIDSTTK